uniref:Uncharacterized protein n=1 Tax=Coccidioides posadasii RMSCC 3488 TaxID=454284 RepID=A0A0J6F7A4_COCPO|nr:hypothetical protein CPAG_05185 [Coccidioides posadasii RMSCC 3488]
MMYKPSSNGDRTSKPPSLSGHPRPRSTWRAGNMKTRSACRVDGFERILAEFVRPDAPPHSAGGLALELNGRRRAQEPGTRKPREAAQAATVPHGKQQRSAKVALRTSWRSFPSHDPIVGGDKADLGEFGI